MYKNFFKNKILLSLIIFSVFLFFVILLNSNIVMDFFKFFSLYWNIQSSQASNLSKSIFDLYDIVFFYLILIFFFVLYLILRMIYLFRWHNSNLIDKYNFNYVNFVLNYNNIDLKKINLTFLNNFKSIILESPNRLYSNFFLQDVLNNIRLSEHRLLEIIWTLLPTGFIIYMLIPSFFLLFSVDSVIDEPLINVKVVGHQWYWTYSVLQDNFFISFIKDYTTYLDSNYIYNFSSNMLAEEDLSFGTHRLLEVDNRLILPTNTPVRFLITSEDVIHSWSVPELGIKVDAIPGRINQIIVEIKRPGVFYGMCSELCGSQHGFMPIVIQAVPIYDYIDWILKLYNFIFDNENTNVINL